ncbi:MAG TPA: rRNA maturation RNase YbeY [Candidatus Acidoferrales bacterium]|nr:rRNA maturation RNase YbeY [Candidatus Acidoferrales bacterium]
MVINRQNRVPVVPARLDRFLVRVCHALDIPRASATVCLVSDAQIAKWNRAYRRKSQPTDVLSFPASTDTPPNGSRLSCHSEPGRRGDRCEESAFRFLHDEPPKKSNGKGIRRREFFTARPKGSYLGDIAIAPAVARRNARLTGRSLDDELRVLILHGVLHLLGYDHETDDGKMARLELRLRRRLGIG